MSVDTGAGGVVMDQQVHARDATFMSRTLLPVRSLGGPGGSLPRSLPASAPVVADMSPKSQVPILIVDDNASKRLALKSVLSPLGYLIVEADSGIAALRHVMVQDFAVILLDVCMPVTDGYATAALIRKRAQSALTPVIFITASVSDGVVRRELYAEGAVDVIFAPVSPAELRAKVLVFANLFLKAEELATRAREIQESADRLSLEAERTLRERDANTQAILDAATDAFVSTDDGGFIKGWNRRAQEIFGWSEPEAVGRRMLELILPKRVRAGLQEELAQFLASGDRRVLNERREIMALYRGVHEFPAELIIWPVRAGDSWGFNALMHDITERKLAQADLAAARDQALAASRMKSQFLANMSHELRTPMNGILGMTSVLLDTPLTADQRDCAETTMESAQGLLTILTNMLDFSKIEAGSLGIESTDFDIGSLVEEVAGGLGAPAHQKSLKLACGLPVDLPPSVNGDPGRLQQVLTNLLGNAVKFTPSGDVLLELTIADVDEDTVMARFQVVDTGIGIAPADQAAMFESFSQADDSDTRCYGGVGLGLAISRQLVHLMGGEIGVRSELGVGSTFWFNIPLRRVYVAAEQSSPTVRRNGVRRPPIGEVAGTGHSA